MGGSWEIPLLGIAVGYIGNYIDEIYPSQHNGSRLIPTPQFLKDLFPTPTSGGMGGTPVTESTRTTRTAWGRGQRLGS
jgi:hypothetical protein